MHLWYLRSLRRSTATKSNGHSSSPGTIEAITLHAINAAKALDTKQLTFGTGATSELHAAHNLGGIRVRMLQHTYQSITKQFKLTQKGDFRQKLGAEEDAVYMCYPPVRAGRARERSGC